LNGIGAPADPVAPYSLYRQASALGVANAWRNQIAVYECRLTPDSATRWFMRENAR
jgi:hypothetical protein